MGGCWSHEVTSKSKGSTQPETRPIVMWLSYASVSNGLAVNAMTIELMFAQPNVLFQPTAYVCTTQSTVDGAFDWGIFGDVECHKRNLHI